MPPSRTTAARTVVAAALTTALATVLAACGSSGSGTAAPPHRPGTVTIGALSNGAARQTTLTVPAVPALHAELPADVARSGRLIIGLGLLPAGDPPLGYTGSDQRTLTGSEPDLGRLVAAVLGLKPVLADATWDNLFVGIDSGRTDVGFSNITDTEQRKAKYDFACYRKDDIAFSVPRTSTWNFDGDYRNLAGKTVAVDAGTNQEKILLAWRSQLRKQGKTLTVKYFPDPNSTYLALGSGKIDAYLAPNPSVAYHVARTAGTPAATRSAGEYSGAGASLQGLICATSKKGDGLAGPVADALNHLIRNGQYAAWLATWHLSGEAVPVSRVNPPGLPLSDT